MDQAEAAQRAAAADREVDPGHKPPRFLNELEIHASDNLA